MAGLNVPTGWFDTVQAAGLLLIDLDDVVLVHLQRLRGLIVINSATVK